jgi:predicted dehydrogenase
MPGASANMLNYAIMDRHGAFGMPKMKVAVIGAGAMGRMHMDVIRLHEGASLAAIADPTDVARTLAEAYQVPWFADYRDLLEEIRPQATIVATPNATHADIGVYCLEHGVPVLIEKPIADTRENAQRLCEAANRTGLPVLVGHHRRHNPILRVAQRMMAEGLLGTPLTATAMATFLKPDAYFDAPWRRQPGGGPILINLIHDIDMMRVLLGEIESLQAMRSNMARHFEVEDTACVMLRFRSGALGTITLSDAAAAPWNWDLAAGEAEHYPRQAVDTHFVAGSHGSLALPSLDYWTYRGQRGWHALLTRERTTPHRANPYVEQLHHLRAVIEGTEPSRCTAADGLATLAATLAVGESARTGAPAFPQ